MVSLIFRIFAQFYFAAEHPILWQLKQENSPVKD